MPDRLSSRPGMGRSLSRRGLPQGRIERNRNGELHFEEVPVPIDHVVGAEGSGVGILAESTGWERALLPSTLLGPMQRSIDSCTEWARKREQFGRPIGAFQQVSSRIANMVMRHNVCRQTPLRHGRSPSAVRHGPSPDATGRHRQTIRHRECHSGSTGRAAGHGRSRLPGGVQRPAGSERFPGGHPLGGTSETLRNTIARFAGLPTTNS